jgi:hypothetical protein
MRRDVCDTGPFITFKLTLGLVCTARCHLSSTRVRTQIYPFVQVLRRSCSSWWSCVIKERYDDKVGREIGRDEFFGESQSSFAKFQTAFFTNLLSCKVISRTLRKNVTLVEKSSKTSGEQSFLRGVPNNMWSVPVLVCFFTELMCRMPWRYDRMHQEHHFLHRWLPTANLMKGWFIREAN